MRHRLIKTMDDLRTRSYERESVFIGMWLLLLIWITTTGFSMDTITTMTLMLGFWYWTDGKIDKLNERIDGMYVR